MDFYSIQEEEIDETDTTELGAALAETHDDEDDEAPSEKRHIPQRFLNEFTIYHRDEASNAENLHEIIPLQAMEHPNEDKDYSFYASGIVTPLHIEDAGEPEELDEDEDENEDYEPHPPGVRVSLSSIIALWVEPPDDQTSDFPCVFIRLERVLH